MNPGLRKLAQAPAIGRIGRLERSCGSHEIPTESQLDLVQLGDCGEEVLMVRTHERDDYQVHVCTKTVLGLEPSWSVAG